MNNFLKYIKTPLYILVVVTTLFSACKKKEPPYACFTAPPTFAVGINTMINSSCSELEDTYAWDFGDGTTSEEENPIHKFDSTGTYTITLKVTNEYGDDTYSEDVEVINPDEIRHTTTEIINDETWTSKSVHIVTRNIFIEGATLTIEAGAIVKIGDGKSINFGKNNAENSKLIAVGTAAKPIRFTAFSDTASAGQWNYLGFYEGTDENTSLKYCNFEYGGGYSDKRGTIHLDNATINMSNCSIKESKYIGVSLDYNSYFSTCTGNTIESCGDYIMTIASNYVHSIGEDNTFTTNTGIFVNADSYIQTDESWVKQTCPYIIDGVMIIGSEQGAKLTIEAGTELNFEFSSGIYVGYNENEDGTLVCDGTSSEPIIFTSSTTSKTIGDWNFIGFYANSVNSSLTYTNFEYGGGSPVSTGIIHLAKSSIAMDNCKIDHSLYYGVILDEESYFESFTNNTISNCVSYPIKIYGNYAYTIGTGNQLNTTAGIEVRGGNVTSDGTFWQKQSCPYIITDDLYIGSETGNALKLNPGVELQFKEEKALHVGLYGYKPGALIADGELGNEIIFTVYDSTGGATPGNWDGIYFYYGTDTSSYLNYCNITYGGRTTSSNQGNINCLNAPDNIPIISNCDISYSEGYGIFLSGLGTPPQESNNTYSNNAAGDRNY